MNENMLLSKYSKVLAVTFIDEKCYFKKYDEEAYFLFVFCVFHEWYHRSCPKRVKKSGKASHSVSDLLKVKTTSNRSIKKYIIKMLGGDDVSGKKK